MDNAMGKYVDEIFMKEPLVAYKAMCFKKQIIDGEVEVDIITTFVQKFERFNEISIRDAYILKEMNELYEKGLLGVARVKVETTPLKNATIQENNAALSKIDSKFEVEFIPTAGRGAEDDGYFRINKGTLTFDFKNKGKREVGELVVPLEVGTTEVKTTHKHLYILEELQGGHTIATR
ncbi:hypothetical protein ACIQ57_07165 [Lysinibacillus xylanilyticus]|uniref:hypothetical protein n=1 Tax=Lysinibacillus xylanilyticus TaxID=582475 RepID=UPI0038084B90